MKKNFLLLLLCMAVQAHAQYFQRYFNEIVVPTPARAEAFSDGLKSRVNYNAGDPTLYYFVGTGYSELVPPAAFTDARLRFIRTSRSGMVNVNNAYQFADVVPLWWESRGKDLCEVDDGMGTGGYIIVGEVNDNPATGAAGIPGFTDWFYGRFTNGGAVNTRKRIDIGGGSDVARGVIRSVFVPGTYLVCGYSVKPAYTDAVVARLDGAGNVMWLKALNMVTPAVPCKTASICYAYSLCEDPATGNIYACGSISGHKAAPDVDGLVFGLTSGGAPIWQVYHDLGGSTDEYHDIKFTSTGNVLACGFSDLSSGAPGGVPFNDTWLTLFSPALMPGVAGMTWSFKHRFGGPIQETKGYRVIEGKNSPSTGGIRYYAVGPTYDAAFGPIQMMLEVFGGGLGGGTYHNYPPPYGPLGFDDRFGLDSVEMMLAKPGLAIFSSILQPPTGPVSDSYLLKTYFNGGTCMNFCTAIPDITIAVPPHKSLNVCKDTVRKVKKMQSITYTYATALICSQGMIGCGFNGKEGDELNTVLDGILDNLDEDDVILYPNPAANQLTVAMMLNKAGSYRMDMLDLAGRVLESTVRYFDEGSSIVNFNLEGLNSGCYVISITGSDVGIRKTFIKE